MLSQFEFALGAFAAGAGAGSVSCVGDVALDDGSGLVAGRGPVAAWPAGCLLDGVADQVARQPDAVALVASEGELSYAELWQRAGALAVELQSRGDRKSTRLNSSH